MDEKQSITQNGFCKSGASAQIFEAQTTEPFYTLLPNHYNREFSAMLAEEYILICLLLSAAVRT